MKRRKKGTYVYKMTEQEIVEHPFILPSPKGNSAEFYHYVFESVTGLSYDKSCKSMDCTKINVSTYIRDTWYELWKEADGDPQTLTQYLLFVGPKALEIIPENEVWLEPGAITLADGTVWMPNL